MEIRPIRTEEDYDAMLLRIDAIFADLLNSRSRASEILNRKRPLSLDQIRKIAKAWNVPAQAMIGEYELTA